MGRKGDGQPSNILWIGYPPNVQIDEQMLHNAMILFGEIERIKSVPSRNYSFVEFRSVDEARCAKEGLQGRLFNDPRIAINFSNGDQGHGKDYPGFYPGSNWPRPDLFVNEHSYRPLQMDLFGHNRPMVPNNFPGHLPTGGIVGPNIQMRPFGPQSGPESVVSGPEFNENSTLHKFQEGSSANKMGSNWKRPSPPAPGLLSSPVPGARLPARSTSGAWDVLDVNRNPRDSKRSRIDVQPGGLDHIWRRLIAKGGTPVCRARCVPVGKGIGTELGVQGRLTVLMWLHARIRATLKMKSQIKRKLTTPINYNLLIKMSSQISESILQQHHNPSFNLICDLPVATILVHQEYYKLYSTCNDLNGIVSSLHLIRDQAQKDEQKKNEDTISSVVASEIKSMIEDQI
ncbi:hypothetical protein P8452_02512 [Trifolium repens]|nr:hypothetical protein P8452_02512 [Trifolium repens]